MFVKNAEFITSYASADMLETDGAPEIAVVGRSNVGKSSLINALANQRALARTSSSPGKTRLINVFRFNLREGGSFTLVDLPGYGFARVSHAEKAAWGAMIEGYLSGSQNIKHTLALVDIRHEPTQDDVAMLNYLRHYGIDYTVVATKCDKLSRAQLGKQTQLISRALQVQPWQIVATSAETRYGLDKLLERIENALQPAAPVDGDFELPEADEAESSAAAEGADE